MRRIDEVRKSVPITHAIHLSAGYEPFVHDKEMLKNGYHICCPKGSFMAFVGIKPLEQTPELA